MCAGKADDPQEMSQLRLAMDTIEDQSVVNGIAEAHAEYLLLEAAPSRSPAHQLV